ncbi:MAG: chromosomal replication initiator protein DnaA [Actinomycetes bacterium]|jgi:chromosomal replication initiator protein|nr:chromosomal replication initiator protein DnaA [Actinomycetes bacterium]
MSQAHDASELTTSPDISGGQDAPTPDTVDIDLIWEETLEHIQDLIPERITETRFRSVFSRMLPVEMSDDGVYVVGMPNAYSRRLAERFHLDLINETIRKVTGNENMSVSIVVDPSMQDTFTQRVPSAPAPFAATDPNFARHHVGGDNAPAPHAPVTEPAPRPDNTPYLEPISPFFKNRAGFTFTTSFDPKLTFDSFVVGDTNSFAQAVSLAVAEQPGQRYNPLFIWGGSGLGKTHLLQAIGAYVHDAFPAKKILYTTSENFLTQYMNILTQADREHRNSNMDEMRRIYRNADVLLVDDVQILEGKEETMNQFFHTFNELMNKHSQIVMTADRSPLDMNIHDRYSSRFSSGILADIQPPSFEVRYTILKKYTDPMAVKFTDEALNWIAEKATDNVRQLESAAATVAAYLGLTKREHTVSLDVAQSTLRDFFPERVDKPVTITAIQTEVCRWFNLSNADLVGSKRKYEIVLPRHIAMYLCYEMTDSSYPQISKAFGGRDHTTVMHAHGKIREKIQDDRDLYSQVQQLRKAIQNRTR